MGVDGVGVELADDEEDDGLEGRQPLEATSPALGGLEQAVDGFEKPVGLTRLRLHSREALSLTVIEPLRMTWQALVSA